jgi:hypothetical protein
MNRSETQWRAQWIWGGTDPSPRNEWRCFRKSFTVSREEWTAGKLSITADSRYVLYVNERIVGRGPSRSWPEEQSYDTYEIGHLLEPGRPNTFAVLVQHFGVSTFSYIRGRGGLLAQLDLYKDNRLVQQVSTDETWRTVRHMGQEKRAQRMSCQLAFAERIDARLWDDEWIKTGFDASHWQHAQVIGEVGAAPWKSLKPRTIPLLTEERIYPRRVESLSRVTPIPWTTCLDLRSQMIPGCADNANAYNYAAYVATVIRTDCPAKGVVGFPYVPPHWQGVIMNGVHYPKGAFTAFRSERYLEVEFQAGDNLLMIVLAGSDHGRGLFMGIDCDSPFALVNPIESLGESDGEADNPFISIGPIESYEYIDHRYSAEVRRKQAIIDACACADFDIDALVVDVEAARKIALFQKMGRTAVKEDLSEFRSGIRRFSNELVSKESVLALSIWKKASQHLPVPNALQHVVHANPVPADVPLYPGEDTEIIIDFGIQGTGYITLDVMADAGTIVDLYGFEHMHEGWIQHTNYLENSLRYICRAGRQQYTSPIRRGFRYLMVTVRGARKPVKLYGVQLEQSTFPVAEIGRFQCSDQMLNEIWRISRLTTKLCMEDTFVDCPAYEQTFWVGDSRNEALISYYLFGGEAIVKRCLELVPNSRTQTPLYVDQVPSGWNSVIPNWTFFWVIACKEYYDRTGDRKFVDRMVPHVDYTLEHYMQLFNNDGLLSMDAWNFLDWAPIDQPREGIVSHQNMFLVKALRSSAVLSRHAGHDEKADAYDLSAEQLAAAINRHLWSEEKGAYLDCIHSDGRHSTIYSMQVQVVALLCDIAKGERKERLLRYLTAPPSDFVPIGSPFMSFFYYEALVQAGQLEAMVHDIRKQYGQMIEYDASTCWEMYPKRKGDRIDPTNLTRSHCHAWSAAPGFFLGAYVLGVHGTDPGWRKVKVQPEACGLSWARGSVPLPDEGRIDVSWRIESSGRMMLQVRLPDGIDADVRLPDGMEGSIEVIRIGV